MIKLSDRLLTIAERLKNSKTMADIGTDHGFLPLYLVCEKGFEKVIMTDISPDSLSKAEKNAGELLTEESLKDKVQMRVGDGLEILSPGEVEAVTVAGMGGKLMRDILKKDRELSLSFKKLVLQPRSGQGHIRKWLVENGFFIVREDLVREGKYITEIITALTPEGLKEETCERSLSFPKELEAEGLKASGDDIIWKIPPWMVEAEGPVEEFLERRIKRVKTILEQVMLAGERDVDTEEKICGDIYYLKGLLKEIRK